MGNYHVLPEIPERQTDFFHRNPQKYKGILLYLEDFIEEKIWIMEKKDWCGINIHTILQVYTQYLKEVEPYFYRKIQSKWYSQTQKNIIEYFHRKGHSIFISKEEIIIKGIAFKNIGFNKSNIL